MIEALVPKMYLRKLFLFSPSVFEVLRIWETCKQRLAEVEFHRGSCVSLQ